MDDIVEKPIKRTLFRQSSTEIRLCPSEISDSDSGSDYENDNKETKNKNDGPKIVDMIKKPEQISESLQEIQEVDLEGLSKEDVEVAKILSRSNKNEVIPVEEADYEITKLKGRILNGCLNFLLCLVSSAPF